MGSIQQQQQQQQADDDDAADTQQAAGTIKYAEWPRDAPTPSEDRVLSIVCGNSFLHWALHEGSTSKFVPILFWTTRHITMGDVSARTRREETPCDVLQHHMVQQAHEVIFGPVTTPSSIIGSSIGSSSSLSLSAAASGAAARRRGPPYLSVYVISTNPEQEAGLNYMFKDVPVKLMKLCNTDFFFSPQQGLYPTMGVDRVAGLYAAKAQYGCPVLLLDGGTAMTYTALDGDSNIIGGGISPGVKLRFQALSDNCGNLPVVGHLRFKAAVSAAMDRHEPLPFFAKDTEVAMMTTVCSELACQLRNIVKQFAARVVTATATAANTDTDTDTAAADTATTTVMLSSGGPSADNNNDRSIIEPASAVAGDDDGNGNEQPSPTTTATAAGEAASEQQQQLQPLQRKQQPASTTTTPPRGQQQQARSNRSINVVVTGGDGKFLCHLLKADVSGIVPTEPGVEPVPSDVKVCFNKTIIHYGMGTLLEKRCEERRALHPDGTLQTKMQGLRVVLPEAKPDDRDVGGGNGVVDGTTTTMTTTTTTDNIDLKRGSVYCVEARDSVDEYTFLIRMDTGERHHWNLITLYDGLVLYNELGEMDAPITPALDTEEWVQEKKRDSAEVQEELARRSGQVQRRQHELGLHKAKGELVDVLCAPATREIQRRAAERARQAALRSAGIPPPSKRAKMSFDPQKYVGRRVAKIFSLESQDDPNILVDEVFYGTVVRISDSKRVWYFVQYDDGDEEEFNLDDLNKGLQLYEEYKADDDGMGSPIAATDGRSTESGTNDPETSADRVLTPPAAASDNTVAPLAVDTPAVNPAVGTAPSSAGAASNVTETAQEADVVFMGSSQSRHKAG